MKYLIVRMYPDVLNIKSYNCQEIGLAKAIVEQGNQCDLVLYTDKNENWDEEIIFDKSKRIHIYYIRAKSFFKNAFFDKKLYTLIKQYDIVQTAEYDQLGNLRLRRLLGDKLIIYHGPYESEYTKGYKKKCMISDIIIKLNKDYKNTRCLSKSSLATEFLIKKGFKNVTTVGVGLDDERFKKATDTLEWDFIKNKGNYKYLLYVGKLEDRRNIVFLLDVFKRVTDNNQCIKLIIIGKGEKEYVEKCWDYAKKINVMDKIIYIESMEQEKLPGIYKNCDIFLLPTKYDIFGMVMLEAMYFGLPIITTLNGGSSILLKNMSEMICSENDIEEWKNKIIDIISDDKLKKELGIMEMKKIKNEFIWNKLVHFFIMNK